MRWARGVAVGVTLAVGTMLGGCDSDESGIDYERACRLLDTDEVSEILDVDVYDGEADTDRTIPASFCQWIVVGGDTSEGGDDRYSLFVSEGSDKDSLEEFDLRRRADDAEKVDDLGDSAYFEYPGDSRLPFLHVRVDDHVATIGVSGDGDHPVNDRKARRLELAAAELVVDRL